SRCAKSTCTRWLAVLRGCWSRIKAEERGLDWRQFPQMLRNDRKARITARPLSAQTLSERGLCELGTAVALSAPRHLFMSRAVQSRLGEHRRPMADGWLLV